MIHEQPSISISFKSLMARRISWHRKKKSKKKESNNEAASSSSYHGTAVTSTIKSNCNCWPNDWMMQQFQLHRDWERQMKWKVNHLLVSLTQSFTETRFTRVQFFISNKWSSFFHWTSLQLNLQSTKYAHSLWIDIEWTVNELISIARWPLTVHL